MEGCARWCGGLICQFVVEVLWSRPEGNQAVMNAFSEVDFLLEGCYFGCSFARVSVKWRSGVIDYGEGFVETLICALGDREWVYHSN